MTKANLFMRIPALSILGLMILVVGAVAQNGKQSPPAGAPPKPFRLPHFEKFTLPNGLQVTMVPYGAIPKVAISVAVRSGTINESAQQTWLA